MLFVKFYSNLFLNCLFLKYNLFLTFSGLLRFLNFPRNPRDLLKSWNLGTGLSERESRLCINVLNLLNHV